MNTILDPFKKFEEKTGKVVFLAGPITDAPSWQKEVLPLAEKLGIDGVTFLSPRKVTQGFPARRGKAQWNWETWGLNICDVVLFWIPNAKKNSDGRVYAQTTRVELGESLARGRKVILGIDSDVSGADYLKYKAAQYRIAEIHDSLEECLLELKYLMEKAEKKFSSLSDRGYDVLEWLKDEEHIKIPEGIGLIQQCAFFNCHVVKSIEIPSTVVDISQQYFGGADTEQLEEFIVSEKNKDYKSVDGVLYTKNGYALVNYPPAKPDKIFKVPSTVRIIEEGAFSNCTNLQTIELPDSLESIGDFAFGYCTTLESINIPSGVTSLPEDAFEGCELLKINKQ